LAWQIEQGLKDFLVLKEYRFCPGRKWRFDLLVQPRIVPSCVAGFNLDDRARLEYVRHCLGIEIEGGLFVKGSGRHNRGAGMRADMEKYNEAVLLGWRILRVLPEWVQSGKAFTLVERAVKGSK
jgi:hypothetical protein